MKNLPKYTIFVGNPGAGKSSLLNALVGKVAFKSGVSFGTGLTKKLQLHEASPGEFYGDTPGLDDVEAREQAAKEISEAFRLGNGEYKLVFLITLESGRIKPADVAVIRLVLDSLPDKEKVPYGVVVNKVRRALKEMLDSSDDLVKQLSKQLYPGPGYQPPFVTFYDYFEELDCKNDTLHKVEPGFLKYLSELHSTKIVDAEDVKNIEAKSFEAILAELEKVKAEHKKQEVSTSRYFSAEEGFEIGRAGAYAAAGAVVSVPFAILFLFKENTRKLIYE